MVAEGHDVGENWECPVMAAFQVQGQGAVGDNVLERIEDFVRYRRLHSFRIYLFDAGYFFIENPVTPLRS